MDMFIEFLAFTNDQLFDQRNTEDLSLLDDTVLNALDINEQQKKKIVQDKKVELTFLEQLVEEQKMKRQIHNKNLIRRISGGIQLDVIQELNSSRESNLLDESFPDHFNMMKNEDSINEGLPSQHS